MSAPTPESSSTAGSLYSGRQHGLLWALLSPLFLGTIPIIAKYAYGAGVPFQTVVAVRTLVASTLLWLIVLLWQPSLLRTSWPALLAAFFAGAVNGIGSLFYYAGLVRVDASLVQLVNASYLVFVALLLRLAGQTISALTLARSALALFAIYLLTAGGLDQPDWLGIGLLLVAALSYALQLVLSQRIMYDVPAPTMAVYAMSGMALVVTLPWLLAGSPYTPATAAGWQAVLLMALFTAFSRLTLFLGVKHLGSIQTALFGVAEVAVTLFLAWSLLDERLTPVQWAGALLLVFSILLVRYERNLPRLVEWWRWLRRR